MTETRRLVHLPGYDDTSRDVYETADSTDDNSTVPTQDTSPRSPSETSDTSDEDGDDEGFGVSRRRLYPARARLRFGAVQTAGNVDLSDRVDGRRRGYKVRRREDAEEDEGLEARIARLRREIEECKIEAGNEVEFEQRNETAFSDLESLGTLLAGIELSARKSDGDASRQAQRHGHTASPGGEREATDEQTLGRVAHFDRRLAALEQELGISALDSAASHPLTMPILPSLTLLDQQIAALISSSYSTSLDTASAKIQKLRGEAEQLAQFQAQNPTVRSSDSEKNEDGESPDAPLLSQDDVTKLQGLYQLLPTLQSLSPTVPALLARLRSLTTLHSNAASAASDLDELEKQQQEMDDELKAWKEGLAKVEEAVKTAGETNGRNGKVVKGWIDDLEARMRGL